MFPAIVKILERIEDDDVEEPSKELLRSVANVMRSLKDHQLEKIRDRLKVMEEHPAVIAVVEREIRWRAPRRVKDGKD